MNSEKEAPPQMTEEIIREALAAGEPFQMYTEDDGDYFWCLINPEKHLCTKLDAPIPGVKNLSPEALD